MMWSYIWRFSSRSVLLHGLDVVESSFNISNIQGGSWPLGRCLTSATKKDDLDGQTLRMIMQSNRDGTGFTAEGYHKEAYECFKHALRWCPLPHELLRMSELASDPEEKQSHELRRYQWTLRRAAIANNLAMAALRCGWHDEAIRLLEADVIGNRSEALKLVSQLFPEKRHFEETQLGLALAVAHRHIASVVSQSKGSPQTALHHLEQAKKAIEHAI